jgi:outer membrane protein assembly factor BamB
LLPAKSRQLGFLTDPVVADGKLLIQAKDGTLYAITR